MVAVSVQRNFHLKLIKAGETECSFSPQRPRLEGPLYCRRAFRDRHVRERASSDFVKSIFHVRPLLRPPHLVTGYASSALCPASPTSDRCSPVTQGRTSSGDAYGPSVRPAPVRHVGFPGQRSVNVCLGPRSGLILVARSRIELSAQVRTAEELECRGEIHWTLSHKRPLIAAKACIS